MHNMTNYTEHEFTYKPLNMYNHKHTLKIVLMTEDKREDIMFDEKDDTNVIFSRFRALYYTLENEGIDYSIILINRNDSTKLYKASRCESVIMYAYNKALLPVNILATIPQ